ncbi:MAG TPA: alpha/beta hydrolase [Microbacterium sp.]|uniref:alpha/beta fold hydrolase n=1 Tax=Microbacterium sp. TaxID=51671 RepID=UPI000EE1DF32|nr:alpha/beta hydrolase [Microbacterium sp.]
MRIILIPGLWLSASSWDDVVPALEAAGHLALPLTMPGVGEPVEHSAEIGMSDWVDAVLAQIDAAHGPVVLVGHSGGGNVVWAAAGARTDKIARVIFVDTVPPAPGSGISEFELVDGVVPFPGWDFFPDEDVYDLDEATRARTTPLTRSVPARVPVDPVKLAEGRHQVPVTLLMGAMVQEQVEAAISEWGPYGDEYRAIDDVTVEKIGSGHWPQFSQPEKLAALITSSVAHS